MYVCIHLLPFLLKVPHNQLVLIYMLKIHIQTRLPDIFEGPTHYRRAKKELRFVKYDGTIKNERNKSRKHTAQSMDTVMKGLTKPITEVNIHTYYHSCIHT